MATTLDTWWRSLHDESRRAHRLSRTECRAFAKLGHFGRLAYNAPSGPDIALTSYVWNRDRVFLPAALAERLCDSLAERRVALEIDDLDPSDGLRPRGMSVVVTGIARLVPALVAWADLAGALGPEGFPPDWPPAGTEQPLMRIDVDHISGWQVYVSRSAASLSGRARA